MSVNLTIDYAVLPLMASELFTFAPLFNKSLESKRLHKDL